MKLLKYSFFMALALLLSACVAPKSTLQKAADVASQQSCYDCNSLQGFEAKIQGLLYLSDVGLQCCADKRTLDTSVAIKKVYLHRINDLAEEKKVFYIENDRYFINEQFNLAFYLFLEQELKSRGIVVVDGINNSPYVLRLDLSFVDFRSKLDRTGLHSNIVASLQLKDINTDKTLTVRTKQDVVGFKNEKEISFYTFLLIKQVANKVASIISSL